MIRILSTLLMAACVFTVNAQTLLWNVEDIDESVVASADKYCATPPVAVTDKAESRSGNKHNYESLSVYRWPDPNNPNGPYITRDGEFNPEYKLYDLPRLNLLVDREKMLGKAFYLTGERKYYDAFVDQLDVWFLDRKTRMVPDFEYSQFVPGRNDGKGCAAGLIDAYNFIDLLEAVRLVNSKQSIGRRRMRKLKTWFRNFADWMMTSEIGMAQSRNANNHGTAYDVTLFYFANFIGQTDVCETITENFAERRITPQIMEDGSQPLELKRTRGYFYSIFNLKHMADFCIIQDNLGYDYLHNEGNRILSAFNYLQQFVGKQASFPYQEIGNWKEQEDELAKLRAKLK